MFNRYESFPFFYKAVLVVMITLTSAVSLSAYDFVADGVYYRINSDSISVSVTYKAKQATTGNSYSGQVTIPAEVSYDGRTYPVTAIGTYAFYQCKNLTAVNMPNTITRIENSAFYVCSQLSSIVIPDSVTFIGSEAFASCISLTEIFIPASVTTIQSMPFNYCKGLTSIVVDENNQYYDSRENCNAIIQTEKSELIAACVNTVIPNSVKRIAKKRSAIFMI